jgi:hypothetical protein
MAPKDGKEVVDKTNGTFFNEVCKLESNVKIKSSRCGKYIVKNMKLILS